MITISSSARFAAITIFTGSVMLAGSAFAAPIDTTAPAGPPNSTINLDSQGDVTSSTPDTSSGRAPDAMAPAPAGHTMHRHHDAMNGEHGAMAHSPEDMKKHVEMRIKTLHEKLMITKEQEPAWNDVANAMRDNESSISGLISQRQQNGAKMTAVDDMESYQKIAQAHADGFNKVIAPFKTLYGQMSDAQKANADKVFGSFEGHGSMGMHHKKTSK